MIYKEITDITIDCLIRSSLDVELRCDRDRKFDPKAFLFVQMFFSEYF